MSRSREFGNIIENAPFDTKWTKIGDPTKESVDSVVGTVNHPVTNDKYVIKWNRGKTENPEEVGKTAEFLKKSIELYKAALGEEFLVPTSIVFSSKRDGKSVRPKTFIFQNYIDGWTGQTVPDEIRESSEVSQQWNLLFDRLSALYRNARTVNCNLNEGETPFPINLTVGSSRRKVLRNEREEKLPNTPNILVDRNSRIYLCDFGAYTPWDPKMENAYNRILESVYGKGVEHMAVEAIARPMADEYGFAVSNTRREPVRMPQEVISSLQGFTLKPGVAESVQKAAEPHLKKHGNYSA